MGTETGPIKDLTGTCTGGALLVTPSLGATGSTQDITGGSGGSPGAGGASLVELLAKLNLLAGVTLGVPGAIQAISGAGAVGIVYPSGCRGIVLNVPSGVAGRPGA